MPPAKAAPGSGSPAELNPLQKAEAAFNARVRSLPAGSPLQLQLCALVQAPRLTTELELRGCAFSVHMVVTLREALPRATALRTLNLHGCLAPLAGPEGTEGPHELAQLAGALGEHAWLTHLDLSWNNLGSGEVLKALVARLCATTCSLTSLDLGFNLLRCNGARALVRALLRSECPGGCPIAHLGLQRTELGPMGAACIAELLAAPTLEELPPPQQQRQPDAADEKESKAKTRAAPINATAKKPPPAGTMSLTSLDLRQNSLVLRKAGTKGATRPAPEGMVALAAALGRNCTLTALDLGANSLGYLEDTAVRALATAVARSRTLTALGAAENMLDSDAAALLAGAARGGGALALLDLRRNRLVPKGSRARPLEARRGGGGPGARAPGGTAHTCHGCHAALRAAEGRAVPGGVEARANALAGRRLQGRPFQTHRRAAGTVAQGTASRPATAALVRTRRPLRHGQQQQQQQRSLVVAESTRRPATAGATTTLKSRFQPDASMHVPRGPSPGRGAIVGTDWSSGGGSSFPRGTATHHRGVNQRNQRGAASGAGCGASSGGRGAYRVANTGGARGLGASATLYARPATAVGWGWGSVDGWRWDKERRSGAEAGLTSMRRGVPRFTSHAIGASAVTAEVHGGTGGATAVLSTGAVEGEGEHVWLEHGAARGGGSATVGISALLEARMRPDVPLTTLRLVDGSMKRRDNKKVTPAVTRTRKNDQIFSTTVSDYIHD